MQIFLRGRTSGLRLDPWEKEPIAAGIEGGPRPGDRRDAYTREVAKEAPGPPEANGPHRRLAAAIWRYDIFPPRVVTGVLRRTPLEKGDTVGILYHAPILADLFFAARVTERFDERIQGTSRSVWRSGYTYCTLRGHPVLGEETFSVEKDEGTGAVRVILQSWSRPGMLLTAAFSPIMHEVQVYASRAALDHLEAMAERG